MTDPTAIVLKVGNDTIPARFAGSVYYNYEEGKYVQARALGAIAFEQMYKGILKAQAYFVQHGMKLSTTVVISREVYNDEEIDVHTATFAATPLN